MMPFKKSFKKKTFSSILFVPALQTSSKTNAREYTTAKLKTLATTVWKLYQLWKLLRYAVVADVKIQPKARDYLLKIHHFCSFSLVSLSPNPRSRRGSERIRQDEGRWSRPPKTALERSDLTEKFQFRESHTEAETRKTPNQIPVPSKKRIIIYSVYICMSTRVQDFHTGYLLKMQLQNGT